MVNHQNVYYRELRQLDDAFARVDQFGVSYELDTDDVEEVLEDWQDLIAELYQDGEDSSVKLAQQIEVQLEKFVSRLEAYIAERIRYEEQDAIEQAGTRLTQSRIENYHHHHKKASEQPDVMRYYRVSSVLRVADEQADKTDLQPKSRLEKPHWHRLMGVDDLLF